MPRWRLLAWLAPMFKLIGVLKYGLVLSVLLVYLPLTTFASVPGHDLFGNLFSELTPRSAFFTTVFVLLAAWTVMIVEGLIVNGIELLYPAGTSGRGYRTLAEIQDTRARVLPEWADKLLSVPVTRAQFWIFTVGLAGPALIITVLQARAGERLWAVVAIAAASALAYGLLLLAAAPSVMFSPNEPPLTGRWLAARAFWEWLGRRWLFRVFSGGAHYCCTELARRFGVSYVLDGKREISSVHLFATMAALGFLVIWVVTHVAFYPARLTAAPVVYAYVGLLTFVWFFGALSFHLARWHISPLAVIAVLLIVCYVRNLDHHYHPAEAGPVSAPSIDPFDVAAVADENLVVVAAAGGGVWAAGWTMRGLEHLVANRPALRREIRVVSAVSGGSVGAAYAIDGFLRGGDGAEVSVVLRDARVRATASSLGPVAYGLAFRDFPRLMTAGIYDPWTDRGRLLQEEWARIAAAPVVGEEVGPRPPAIEGKRALRSLNPAIRAGVIPAPIFGATVMETGQRLMITPMTLPESERARTLQEFLFGSVAATPEPDLDLWTAARLSATFTYISPAARSWLDVRHSQREHLIDGGYYDHFGVAAALDWLDLVLRARQADDPRLRFRRVLLIELSGFPEPDTESVEPAAGITATLTGPLTVFLRLREGIAVSRNRIDVDRFKRSWNHLLAGRVQIETVKFAPDKSRPRGPVSWHLSSREIESLKKEWGPGSDPNGWAENLKMEWSVLDGFLRGARPPR
jgi:hypothetical protein